MQEVQRFNKVLKSFCPFRGHHLTELTVVGVWFSLGNRSPFEFSMPLSRTWL